jgi:anti-sigma regulatory factor (Ser/Thr protein kinase)
MTPRDAFGTAGAPTGAVTAPDLVMQLPDNPGAVAIAREVVRGAAQGNLSETRTANAVLLTSELVTNALLHAGSPVSLRVQAQLGRISVAVGDQSTKLPTPRALEDRPLSVGGRGLLIVAALASLWGSQHGPNTAGKVVWFEVHDEQPAT